MFWNRNLEFCVVCACVFSLSYAEQQVEPDPPKVFENGKYAVSGAPWTASVDGDVLYFTVTGPSFDPKETEEDGFIYSLKAGEKEAKPLTQPKYMISPKGILAEEDFLVVLDVEQLYLIDKKKGTLNGYVNIGSDGPLKGLTCVARMPDRLIVSCTDKNKLYFVDAGSRSFGEFVPKEKIYSPMGIVWDPDNKVLYLAECAEEKDERGHVKPSGRLLAINSLIGEVNELKPRSGKPLRGKFSALALKDGELYFSDWVNDNKPEAIRKYNLKTGHVSNVATVPMQKVTGLTFQGDQLIITSAQDNSIIIMTLPKTKR